MLFNRRTAVQLIVIHVFLAAPPVFLPQPTR
jgi:hypothetical protein